MRHVFRVPIVLAFALLMVSTAPSFAQTVTSPDFLFGKPRGTIGVRTGWVFASADSDLFAFVQDHLTLDRKDFNAPAIGIDVDLAVTPRASVVFGFDFSNASKLSEYRRFAENGLPITQETTLREMNLSGGIKYALTPRGREISSRAWIPSAFTPYVGAGGGILNYRFVQFGDFVDVETVNNSIFTATLRSDGWTPSAHVFGGVDVKVWKRLYLSGEGRYLWSRATPDRDFGTFDSIDLAGFKASAGLHYMF